MLYFKDPEYFLSSAHDHSREKSKATKDVQRYIKQPIFGNMFSEVKNHKPFKKIKLSERWPITNLTLSYREGAAEAPEYFE